MREIDNCRRLLPSYQEDQKQKGPDIYYKMLESNIQKYEAGREP